jgi:hypothetical protein
VRYRSQVIFRVGSQWLPSSGAKSNAPYSWYRKSSLGALLTRLSRSVAVLSKTLQLALWDINQPIHISPALLQQIQIALCCFRSLLLTASLLVSFPAGTKMLQFPAFPFLSERLGDPWFEVCMQLAKAYRSLPRPSSVLEPSYPLDGLHDSLLASNNLNSLFKASNAGSPEQH